MVMNISIIYLYNIYYLYPSHVQLASSGWPVFFKPYRYKSWKTIDQVGDKEWNRDGESTQSSEDVAQVVVSVEFLVLNKEL